ncbi:MAG: hypothetical protein K0S33_3210 [Bacteroidetes bacterium]|jgi:hypothetical protein|nr:hypothetical protein [Bacteroidota bacterium]
MEIVVPESKIKRAKTILRVLLLIAICIVCMACYLSIYTDGIGVGIGIVIPFSILILIVLIFAIVIGFRNRKSLKKWYLYGVLILCFGLYLWSPLMKPTRELIERNVRWDARNKVVEDIRDGILVPVEGYVIVPFERYGRVSFLDMYVRNRKGDNVVTVEKTPENGLVVEFMTDRGFFGPKHKLIYVEKPTSDEVKDALDDHWLEYVQNFSWFR